MLTSSDSTRAKVPASVTIPEGATIAYFDLQAGTVNSSVPVSITATFGTESGTASITIRRAAVSNIHLAATSLKGGTTMGANRINLDGLAGDGRDDTGLVALRSWGVLQQTQGSG